MNAIGPDGPAVPFARLEVVEAGARPRDPGAIPCVLGRDFVVEPEALGAYCLRDLPRRVDDLVLLAGAVSYADRVLRRRAARGWERSLHLSLPVLEPDFWAQPVVAGALSRTLRLLTGDGWSFEFARRRAPLTRGGQAVLAFGDAPALVMPFSDGLDSMAVARLTAEREPRSGLILVTVGRLRDPDADWRVRCFKGRYHRVGVPFRRPRNGSGTRLKEQSYRSRAFVFGVMAGVAAGLLGAERILVSESGQGALGPSLTPVGNEAPDLRMHPGFTRSLADLFALVLERPVLFEHPRLWSTKGETLAELRGAGLAGDWGRTRSCSRDQRDVSLDGRRVQCGVCANCLLRRQSLMASGLGESGERYLWPRLSADSLAASAAEGGRAATRNDEQHAACGVLAMAELAALAAPGPARPSLGWATADLAGALDEPVAGVRTRLARLLAAHRAEWDAFTAAQGPASFVARLSGQVLR